MLSYLTAEANFLRAFGNRSLLLLLLCVIVRTADGSASKMSALGVSVEINPASIVWFGPIIAFILLVSLKMEADTLRIAREVVLKEASELNLRIKISRWVYFLFFVPTVVAFFMTLQFVLKLFPGNDCSKWSWTRQFTDFSFWEGSPSIYCFGDLTKGTPWIYPPIQTYLYIFCIVGCAYLTWRMAKEWELSRGGKSPGAGRE